MSGIMSTSVTMDDIDALMHKLPDKRREPTDAELALIRAAWLTKERKAIAEILAINQSTLRSWARIAGFHV